MSSRRLRGGQPPGSAHNVHTSFPFDSADETIDFSFLKSANEDYKKVATGAISHSSSDDAERPGNGGQGQRAPRQTRQQKRGASGHDGDKNTPTADDVENEEGDGDGEVTRCICGQLEYPGPPVPLSEGGRSTKGREASLAAAEGLPENAGDLFIQCDTCKVWQHGGCVGIMQEELSPDEYFCEQCRKDLHKLMTGARNQRYSRYIPYVVDARNHAKSQRRSSASKETESRSSREAEGKSHPGMSSAKRRSTMNSRRDLEEEEMVRQAIEQSKAEDGTGPAGTGTMRRSKRGRDEDTDESREAIKRRKTGSRSESPPAADKETNDASSEGDTNGGRSRSNTNQKKSRNAAAQAQRERELREREKEREQERLEAAGRRKGRMDRRRVDESEAPEEAAKPPTTSRTVSTSKNGRSQPPAKPSPNPNTIPPVSTSHKKKGTAKKGRVGRNQYTKDRDLAQDKKTSPRESNSNGGDDAGNGQEAGAVTMLSNGSKPSKPRHMNPNRTSMNDLRKRAAGILEYITRTQVEMAGSHTPSTKDKDSSGTSTPTQRNKNGGVDGSSKLSAETTGADEEEKRRDTGKGVDEEVFKEFSSLQMMDVLTRELVLWQKEFGKYGEKS